MIINKHNLIQSTKEILENQKFGDTDMNCCSCNDCIKRLFVCTICKLVASESYFDTLTCNDVLMEHILK